MLDLKNIIESLLFVSDEPLAIDKLRAILETADGKEIRAALQALSEEYAARGGGFHLQEVAGGWQIRSRPEYHEWIKRLLQPSPQRLSRASLETLAVIAYKQPIIRVDIEHIRGVDCGGVLRQLMERKLIRVLGRREIAGRPLIYATTKLFLEMFDLKDLNDLPTPKEIAELGNVMADSVSQPTPYSPAPQEEANTSVDLPSEPDASDVLIDAEPSIEGGNDRVDVAEPESDPEGRIITSRVTVIEERMDDPAMVEIHVPVQAAPPLGPGAEPSGLDEKKDLKNS